MRASIERRHIFCDLSFLKSLIFHSIYNSKNNSNASKKNSHRWHKLIQFMSFLDSESLTFGGTTFTTYDLGGHDQGKNLITDKLII